MADNVSSTTRGDDGIQHGIDDNPEGDAKKGGVLGAVGGAVVGALAGGPVGAVIGAVAGGAASAAGVAAVDAVDNDNTVTGIGHGATRDVEQQVTGTTTPVADATYAATGTPVTHTTHTVSTPVTHTTHTVGTTTTGVAGAVPVRDSATDVDTNLGANRMDSLGETVPSIKTGGVANDGTPDTRGLAKRPADALTGDPIDDKTGRVVKHP
jgi:hypothetical protein